MRTEAFDYDLPPDRIAQRPLAERDLARLLVDMGDDRIVHARVRDLPRFVGRGDVLVVNETRVLAGRLRFRRRTGGEAEVLLVEDLGGGTWEALVRPSRRLAAGSEVELGDDLVIRFGEDLGGGRRHVQLRTDDLQAALARHGEVPLPPYVRERLEDPERYQTVYARRPASAAAPTAGLHLTPGVLDRCREAGAGVVRVELVVGLDTFRPIATDVVEAHRMHSERYRVPPETWHACGRARRVIAVGTTVVRALETAAATGRLEGRTGLFIHHPFDFAVVDVLLTNFHLPRSSLLVLLDAFVGSRWRELYAEAMAAGYRFLSFGDAMLVARREEDRG